MSEGIMLSGVMTRRHNHQPLPFGISLAAGGMVFLWIAAIAAITDAWRADKSFSAWLVRAAARRIEALDRLLRSEDEAENVKIEVRWKCSDVISLVQY